MKKSLILFFIFLLGFSYAQQKMDSVRSKLNRYFNDLTGYDNFNGNVIVVKNGMVLLDKSYNMKNGIDSMKVTKDSKFIIASVSKVYIKFAILKLVEINKLKLDDTLGRFIPGFSRGRDITIEQLLLHKAGLPRELTDYESYDNLSLDKIVELAKKEPLVLQPGEKVFYSNVGYFLLHAIINTVWQKGYEDFIKNEVLAKMGLQNTGEFNASGRPPHFAYGFSHENGKIVPVPQAEINRSETGNYYGTIGDLYQFSEQLLNGKVLRKDLAQKMFTGDTLIMQAGGRPGYRSYFYKDLKKNVTFIFLANYSNIPFQEVTENVIRITDRKIYSNPRKMVRQEINVSEEQLKKYAGKYVLEIDPRQVFHLVVENGQLIFIDGGEKIVLKAEEEQTFFDDPNSQESYFFDLDNKTKTYNLVVTAGGVQLKTKRVE